MKYGVLEYEKNMELSRHAGGQIKEFSGDVVSRTVEDILDVPGEASRMLEQVDGLIVMMPVGKESFVPQVVDRLIEAEMNSGKPVVKVIAEKNGRNRHDYRRETQALAREKAEKLVKKVENI
jgi:hypothetical protein